jgi:hypothetical protein
MPPGNLDGSSGFPPVFFSLYRARIWGFGLMKREKIFEVHKQPPLKHMPVLHIAYIPFHKTFVTVEHHLYLVALPVRPINLLGGAKAVHTVRQRPEMPQPFLIPTFRVWVESIFMQPVWRNMRARETPHSRKRSSLGLSVAAKSGGRSSRASMTKAPFDEGSGKAATIDERDQSKVIF